MKIDGAKLGEIAMDLNAAIDQVTTKHNLGDSLATAILMAAAAGTLARAYKQTCTTAEFFQFESAFLKAFSVELPVGFNVRRDS